MGSDQPVNSSIRLWFKSLTVFGKVSFNYFGHFVSVVSSWHSWLYPITHLNTHLFTNTYSDSIPCAQALWLGYCWCAPGAFFSNSCYPQKNQYLHIFSKLFTQRDCFIIFNLFRSRHFRICSSEAGSQLLRSLLSTLFAFLGLGMEKNV